MRHKLALTIALASFGVVTALGVGFAGADGTAGVSPATGAGGSLSGAELSLASIECTNGIDDDGDGLIDAEDQGCVESSGASEEPQAQEASQPEGGGEVPAEPAPNGFQAGSAIHAGGNVH